MPWISRRHRPFHLSELLLGNIAGLRAPPAPSAAVGQCFPVFSVQSSMPVTQSCLSSIDGFCRKRHRHTAKSDRDKAVKAETSSHTCFEAMVETRCFSRWASGWRLEKKEEGLQSRISGSTALPGTTSKRPVQEALVVVRLSATDAVDPRDCHCGCDEDQMDDEQLRQCPRRDGSSVHKGLQEVNA